ncbi:hypothetical protein A1356_02700 [Methylomonas koyamae]|uniref:Uncharacterized protein n=1 Tax=Methylomonas koyamae TaxID=702114 RepID=A0AA91I354_9GAMM|nr:hypothetical protein A1356_02700 [Methylomonas koyamae]
MRVSEQLAGVYYKKIRSRAGKRGSSGRASGFAGWLRNLACPCRLGLGFCEFCTTRRSGVSCYGFKRIPSGGSRGWSPPEPDKKSPIGSFG